MTSRWWVLAIIFNAQSIILHRTKWTLLEIHLHCSEHVWLKLLAITDREHLLEKIAIFFWNKNMYGHKCFKIIIDAFILGLVCIWNMKNISLMVRDNLHTDTETVLTSHNYVDQFTNWNSLRKWLLMINVFASNSYRIF